MFVNIVADGGNLLLNFGAMPSGEIPWEQQLRILAMGQWLKVNGSAIYASRPFEQSRLKTNEGLTVRLTQGSDGASYALVCGRPDSATIQISGLPRGEVHLLGYSERLKRQGDSIHLPTPPDTTPVFTLRIDPSH
jgi:alpha-L-fucosidase